MKSRFNFLYLAFLFVWSLAIHAKNEFILLSNAWKNPQIIDASQIKYNDQKTGNEEVTHFSLQTISGVTVPVTFYNRNSDTIIVAAQGLPAPKESMNIFAKLFPNYDLILFDYRWNNQYGYFLAKSLLFVRPIKGILLDEIEELETVVHFIKNKKEYKKIIGLGQCYSCFHLLKLQTDMKKKTGGGPFSHLILDSCWYSLYAFAKSICRDPYLPFHPQTGGAPVILKWISDNWFIKNISLAFAFLFISNISVAPYISKLDIPTLFIHGQNDKCVPLKDFRRMWNAANHNRCFALLTPFFHSDNLKNKQLYQSIVTAFIEFQIKELFEKNTM